MKAAMVGLHLILVGGVFLLDKDLIKETRVHPWYTAVYLLLLITTISQYFYTSGSSPGYVLDVMKDKHMAEAVMKHAGDAISCSTSRMDTQLIMHTDDDSEGILTSNGRARGKDPAVVLNVPETVQSTGPSSSNWSCPYCHVWQPPRSKHCHDCDRCVLGFDHHCVWLGTCIGEGNHCRFWWYIFEETILGIWTAVMYITSFVKNGSEKCYLVLTNQTTYEAVRRRRIPYFRGIPDGVHPFSKGLLRNIYSFCCSRNDFYAIDFLPPIEELEAKARPYTFWDILSCRCC